MKACIGGLLLGLGILGALMAMPRTDAYYDAAIKSHEATIRYAQTAIDQLRAEREAARAKDSTK